MVSIPKTHQEDLQISNQSEKAGDSGAAMCKEARSADASGERHWENFICAEIESLDLDKFGGACQLHCCY